MLSPIHHMVSLKGKSVFRPVCCPPRSQRFPNANWGPAFPLCSPQWEKHNCSAVNTNAIHTILAGWGLLRILACPWGAGFPHCCYDGHSGPQSQDGQPDLPQLAVRACVFAHIYISLPLIIHLANFKGALQSQLAVLGFITFISCISLAGLANNASLKHSLA